MKQLKNFAITIITLTLLLTQSLSAQSLRLLHEKNYDVQPGKLLEIQSDLGDIKITTWDKDIVSIKVFGDRNAADDVKFYFNQTSNGVLIDAEKRSSWSGWFSRIRVKYEIDVPRNFNLDLKTGGGDILVLDINGEINLKTSGGDITCEEIRGNIVATTSGGDIELINHVGNVDVKTSGGDIDIKTSNGKINATTSGGDITVNYLGENKGINLRTSGGDVVVKIPESLKADLELRTSGGSIKTNIEARIRESSKTKFIGQMNGGGLELYAKTSGGDIRIQTY